MPLVLNLTGIAAIGCIAASIITGFLHVPGHRLLAASGVVLMLAHVFAAVWIIPLAALASRPAAWLGMAGTLITAVVFVSSLMDHRHWHDRWRLLHSGAAFGYALVVTHAIIAGPDAALIPAYGILSAAIGILVIVRYAQIPWQEYLFRLATGATFGAVVLLSPLSPIQAQATPLVTCTLRLPDHALTAQGLATPFQLEKGCDESNPNESAFVQAAIINPGSGMVSLYSPLVIDAGTTPSATPVTPTFNPSDVVALWFGFNGDILKLANTGDDHCQQFQAQFSDCNAPAWFAAANGDVTQGILTIPPLGTALDGLPCPTTRDASIVDQDQSDNLPLPGNGSDNGLLDNYVDPALGCHPWLAPDLSRNGMLMPSLALNELQAAAYQANPVMLVPLGDPMVHHSHKLVELYRAGVDQPQEASDNTQEYCEAMRDTGLPRLVLDQSYTSLAASPFSDQASSLYAFLGLRFSQSWQMLKCHGDNPVKLTTSNGIVTGWQGATGYQDERAER